MKREIKSITKIIMIVIIAIATLLILPKKIFADSAYYDGVLHPVEWKNGEATFKLDRGGRDRQLYKELQEINWNSFNDSNKSSFVSRWFGTYGKDIVDDDERNSKDHTGFFWCSPRAGNPTNTQFNIFCCEFSKDSGIGYNSDEAYDVGEIIFIEPNEIKAYKNTNKYKNGLEIKLEGSDNEKWQKILAAAYAAQTSKNVNERLAEYFAHDKPFNQNGLGQMSLIQENCAGVDHCSPVNLADYNDEISQYKYAGIFVTYSAWGGSGQARRAFHVIREKSIPKVNLTINKVDSLTNQTLQGVQFRLEITNVARIGNYQVPTTGQTQNSPKVVYVTTDPSGQIKLTGMEPSNVNNDITVKITEMKVASTDGTHYYKSIDPITITIESANGKYSEATTSNSSISEIIDIKNNNVMVRIENQPLIDISGKVWLDGQTGEKNVAGPNGNKDSSEAGIEGVLVELRNANGTSVVRTTRTNANGEYSFTGVPQTNNGYKIYFSYDGINYIETKEYGKDINNYGTDSAANEINRSTFNNRFKTISATQSNDGTALTYTYSNNDSILNVNIDGTVNTNGTVLNNENNSDTRYRMTANTSVYKTSTLNADCGLVKKEFDLAIGTDVSSARLTINGKETTYSYAKRMNGEMGDLTLDEVLEGNSSEDKDITYNLYLYRSDYNYRIEDYTKTINNKVNGNEEFTATKESQLKAYVTYVVYLKNQTYREGVQVDEFVYYYDQKYKPLVEEGDVIDGYTVTEKDTTNHKITFERSKDVTLGYPNYRAEVNIEFEVNVEDLKEGNSFANIAEITEYTTEAGGLIDNDSAPGNAEVEYENGTPSLVENNSKGYEDDTDKAKGITIKLRDGERTITGTVWDDGKFNNANGVKDGGENPEDGVNDVIVQLIEIKTINGQNYEYIWQETRSGSGTVKKLSEDGQSITEYTNQYPTGEGYDGYYEFEGYIPGNYIIRFIYGDGTTYDLTENIKTYNGQDYKSTIDPSYKQEWFNASNYSETKSVARDNEARRLQVMSDSTIINKDVGQSLENRTKEDLENTWMAAETSKINIPVDADTKPTDEDNTTEVAYENIGNTLSFADMNFGLALRPETKLILEKHITGLKITPNGTGVQSIIDAKADISQVINDTNIDVSGVTEGLATIKSTRDNRGFWQVATDVEELAQGAQLEVEYTYVVRNDSDEDYLSEALVTAYTNQDIKSYSQTLGEIRNTVKTTMRNGSYSYSDSNVIGKYLGQFYYTGIRGENDTPVLSRVETIEEALNNDLKFDAKEGTSGNDFEEKVTNEDEKVKTELNADGIGENTTIETVIQNTSVTDFLTRYTGNGDEYHEAGTNEDGTKRVANADYSKTVTLRTVLTSNSNGELGGNYQSYIAEIMQYSNAAGRRNMEAEPANLSYVNSEDTNVTLDNSWIYEIENGDGTTTKHTTQNESEIPENAINVRLANEADEFWGETIIITKPTGEDRLSALAITIIVISSLAVIAVGIVLIKKFVIKK